MLDFYLEYNLSDPLPSTAARPNYSKLGGIFAFIIVPEISEELPNESATLLLDKMLRY